MKTTAKSRFHQLHKQNKHVEQNKLKTKFLENLQLSLNKKQNVWDVWWRSLSALCASFGSESLDLKMGLFKNELSWTYKSQRKVRQNAACEIITATDQNRLISVTAEQTSSSDNRPCGWKLQNKTVSAPQVGIVTDLGIVLKTYCHISSLNIVFELIWLVCIQTSTLFCVTSGTQHNISTRVELCFCSYTIICASYIYCSLTSQLCFGLLQLLRRFLCSCSMLTS